MRPDEFLSTLPADATATAAQATSGWYTLTMGAGTFPADAVLAVADRLAAAPGAFYASVRMDDGRLTAVTVTF
ncbi:MAG: hypothetical protein HY854_07900 [Burkholderiales bacterium]|nr:hypothetical protein [Burkholderiales bacterium]